MSIIFTIKDNDWNSVRQAIQKLASTKLGTVATPTFTGLNLTTLSVASATISSITFTSATGFQTLGVTSARISSLAVTSATFGDAYITAPNQIYLLDHDSFAGFVATEHVDHATTFISVEYPMFGSGSLTASRTLTLAYSSTLTLTTTQLHVVSSALNHDILTNFLVDEHYAHSQITIFGNAPLSGGGPITSDIGFSLSYTSTMAVSSGHLHVLISQFTHDSWIEGHQSVATTASPVFDNVFVSTKATFGSSSITAPYPVDNYTIYVPTPTGFALERTQNNSGAAVNAFCKARGTYGARKAVLSGDQLLHLTCFGYWGDEATTGSFHSVPSGDIYMFASEPFTSTAAGGYWQFQAITPGTATRTPVLDVGVARTISYSPTYIQNTTTFGVVTTACAAFSTCGDLTAVGSAVLSARFVSVSTAVLTAIGNNQMTISQNTLGITFNIQGNDGIWRTGTLALAS